MTCLYRIAAIAGILLILPIAYAEPIPSISILLQPEVIERVKNYCFDKIMESANPVQDLIDAGLISSSFTGYDCSSIMRLKY